MSHHEKHAFRIDWDLRELGNRPAASVALATAAGLSPREFARAIAMGEIPANAPDLLKLEDEAA